jgi:hypothetical protein
MDTQNGLTFDKFPLSKVSTGDENVQGSVRRISLVDPLPEMYVVGSSTELSIDRKERFAKPILLVDVVTGGAHK